MTATKMISTALLALSFVPLALSVPTDPVRNLYPGATTDCPTRDPHCDCITNRDYNTEIFCGYVDRDWHKSSKNKRAPFDFPHNYLSLAPRDSQAPADASPPVTTFSNDMITDAIKLLSPAVLEGSEKVIRNQLDPTMRGHYPMGLAGTTLAPTTVTRLSRDLLTQTNVTFPAGAMWSIRWDFSWYGPNNTFPASGVLGTHVEALIQMPNNPNINVSMAFYPPTDSDFVKAIHTGDYFLEKVLTVIIEAVDFDISKKSYRWNEFYSARQLADIWYKSYVKSGGSPIRAS